MKKHLKLKSRDLDDALENIDYIKIMDSVCGKYSKTIDPDDISSLRLEILWKCLNSFDESRGVKFTTFLYQQLNYAMMNQLRIRRREKNGAYHHLTMYTKYKRDRYIYQCMLKGKEPVK